MYAEGAAIFFENSFKNVKTMKMSVLRTAKGEQLMFIFNN